MVNFSTSNRETSSEHATLKHDFTKALLVNIFFLALMVGLYFANQNWKILDHISERFQ